jgi:hypothetical protein
MTPLTKEELDEVMLSIWKLQALSISKPSTIAASHDIQGVLRQAWRVLDNIKDRCKEGGAA